MKQDDVAVLIIDMQEKLMPSIYEFELLEKKGVQLVSCAGKLNLPVCFTEQYPKGLGKTLPNIIQLAPEAPVLEKTRFSADCSLDVVSARHIVLAGVEAHICVRQTVYDLKRSGRVVHVLADAVGSREPLAKEVAMREMQADGVLFTTLEGFLFELLQDSQHPKFKNISKILK